MNNVRRLECGFKIWSKWSDKTLNYSCCVVSPIVTLSYTISIRFQKLCLGLLQPKMYSNVFDTLAFCLHLKSEEHLTFNFFDHCYQSMNCCHGCLYLKWRPSARTCFWTPPIRLKIIDRWPPSTEMLKTKFNWNLNLKPAIINSKKIHNDAIFFYLARLHKIFTES